jgi:ribonuclease P protein component
MTLVALVDPAVGHPHVAYAIPRAHGSAVRRNRARRRLREACRTLDRQGRIEPGLYLIAPRPVIDNLAPVELSSAIHDAFERVSVP